MFMTSRYAAQDLLHFATALLERAGLDHDKAGIVADILLEGDLLGHDTHGLHLLAPYLGELERGSMTKTGRQVVLHDKPAALTWDGRRLPGPWLVATAIDEALPRARDFGSCSVAIRRSHHIACLAAYLGRVTDQGMAIVLTSSDPNNRGVAPHGGRRGVYTPNPIAAGWPTGGDPVLIDVSTSISTNGMNMRLRAEGRKFPGQWMIDNEGNPTDDPAAARTDPPGALLPLGGVESGHKGYALGLLVEMLTQGLAGDGRADPQLGWSANVFLQIFDPAAFAGYHDFVRQTAFLAAACRDTPPRPGFDRVRLPGERALQRRTVQLLDGVSLHPSIMPALAPWAGKLGSAAPAPLAA
ncbi:MAG: Ldh family oxidoreductase [Burkholderiales bacterium]|nr:Ldh family oxidoreductase [Burkholderiales bacterium]